MPFTIKDLQQAATKGVGAFALRQKTRFSCIEFLFRNLSIDGLGQHFTKAD